MRFTFGSWNLNNRSLQNGHIEMLRTVDCDLLAFRKPPSAFTLNYQGSIYSIGPYRLSSFGYRALMKVERGDTGVRSLAAGLFDLIHARSCRS